MRKKRRHAYINNDEDLGRAYSYELFFHRVRQVKSTKVQHECFFCKQSIPTNSSTSYISGKDIQVGFYHYHVCKKCSP